MKKILALALACLMVFSLAACGNQDAPAPSEAPQPANEPAASGIYTPGTYTGEGQGYGGVVKVTITVDANSITDVTITGDNETPAIGGAALEELAGQVKTAQGADIDGVSGASLTSAGVKEAAASAIAQAKGESVAAAGPLSFTAGTYNGIGKGYLGDVELAVTFSDTAVTGIEIVDQKETDHIGVSAYDIVFPDIVAANGTGVDALSGATFTSRAIKEAVNDAAEQAGVSDLAAFKKNTVVHEAQAPIDLTYDVVIVGAGGAGMSAAAQAAQNGDTVIVLEKNAEIGGNTLVAGGGAGGFQAYVPYLCWDASDPNATTGYCDYDGQTYDKVKANHGTIAALKTILSWSEDPFDGTVDADHPFVAGDIGLNAVRGVHAEYLPVLKTLKSQIKAYLDWAEPKLAAGANETDLTLFGSNELHIFQTYYGGLRPNADNTEWIYPVYDLAEQFVTQALDMKYWLMDQGALITMDTQDTLIGCLWQRINGMRNGSVIDGVSYYGNYGILLKGPEVTMTKANEKNQILTRTTAKELIMEDGKVTGVKAVQYDGTEVTVHANKGVILATGGYAANIKMVQEYNTYWKPEFIADNIGTTNRSSLTGDGITMATAVGASLTGVGWPQMMPLSWVDNGNLSLGAGENVIFVNATTGKRFVDESAERDVLSKGAFENGMSMELATELGLKNVPGIYVEFSNPDTNNFYGISDIEGRRYVWTVDQIAEKLHLDKQTIIDTITEYDNYVMGVSDELEVEKLTLYNTIGSAEMDDNGNYKPETYKIDKVLVRFMAPGTHHTMGGVTVDVFRHVLNESGDVIPGLYAAGEVTGGPFGGNRLGGNAVIDIMTAGRIAANAVNADNK